MARAQGGAGGQGRRLPGMVTERIVAGSRLGEVAVRDSGVREGGSLAHAQQGVSAIEGGE